METCKECGKENPKDTTEALCAACGSFFGPCCVCQWCGAKQPSKPLIEDGEISAPLCDF